LEVLAARWSLQTTTPASQLPLVVALDARMHEVYWACYQWQSHSTGLITLNPPSVSALEDFSAALTELKNQRGEFVGLGSGFAQVNLPHTGVSVRTDWHPEARVMLEWLALPNANLPKPCNSFELSPTYLRNEVAWKKRERIRQ
jgi:tRNA threonylcarbamoyladenosine biosynthesis protein TsaB